MSLTYGSLFSGYSGLDMGVQSVLGGETAWHVEFDKAPSAVLAHHWPDVPNYGDITKVDFSKVDPIDVLTGGYPCQPFSHAGRRQGVDDDRHLWPYVAQAIAVLRPGLCVFENVRGHLSLGFDEVLRDLKQLGYSVRWYTLRAADIGAAHGRARLFIFAEDMRNEHRVCGRPDRRRGMDRDISHHGGHLHDPSRGCDGHKGDADPLENASNLRRARIRDEATVGSERGEDPLDGRRSGGCTVPRGGVSTPDPEDRSGHDGSPHVGGGRGEQDGTRSASLDTGASGAMRGGEAPHPRPELSGAADGAGSARPKAGGGLPVGRLVGAGRRPVRPGGVSGEPSDVRSDGCWACVRDALLERAAGVAASTAATPADAGAVGRQWRAGVERDGRDATVRGQEGGHSIDGRSASPDLTLLPTPTSSDANSSGGSNASNVTLTDATVRTRMGTTANERLLPTPTASDTNGAGAHGDGGADLRTTVSLLPTPRVTQAGYADDGRGGKSLDVEARRGNNWGDYAAAITRWEHVIGRPAPNPTETGAKGNPRLSPKFCEWLMGLPEGHVTSEDIGLTRNEMLRALGNGVVPTQAAAATRAWLEDQARMETA